MKVLIREALRRVGNPPRCGRHQSGLDYTRLRLRSSLFPRTIALQLDRLCHANTPFPCIAYDYVDCPLRRCRLTVYLLSLSLSPRESVSPPSSQLCGPLTVGAKSQNSPRSQLFSFKSWRQTRSPRGLLASMSPLLVSLVARVKSEWVACLLPIPAISHAMLTDLLPSATEPLLIAIIANERERNANTNMETTSASKFGPLARYSGELSPEFSSHSRL